MNNKTYFADIVIKNACIADGTSNPYYYDDIAIRNGVIVFIGNTSKYRSGVVIDADGKMVTPGFIDSHSHSDASVWANPECQSTVRQGVTTEIVGQCGMIGPAFAPEEIESIADDIVSIYDQMPPDGTFDNVFPKIEKIGISENFVWFCGHNKLREIAGINGKNYSKKQFNIMEHHLRIAMEAGFAGLSTGLEFLPGSLASQEEINKLVGVIKEYDGIYTSHIRNRDSKVYEALEEFINVIRRHKVRGVVSHLSIRENTGAPENALKNCIGINYLWLPLFYVTSNTDMIPTIFAMGPMRTLLPNWVTEDGWENARKILGDPEKRKILRYDCDRYWRFIHKGDWDRVRVQVASAFPEIAGMSFPDIAKKWNKNEWDCLFDILQMAQTEEDFKQIKMMSRAFSEEDIVYSITDPLFSWAVDGYTTVTEGPLASQTCNPKHYMDMMYFFTHHVRDNKIIPFEKAVSKLTSFPATFYGLSKRGQINEGYYADINIFNLSDLKTHATFENPYVYSEGMEYVIVNGVPVIFRGEHTHKRPGRILKHNISQN